MDHVTFVRTSILVFSLIGWTNVIGSESYTPIKNLLGSPNTIHSTSYTSVKKADSKFAKKYTPAHLANQKPDILEQIKLLRAQGKLAAVETLALKHLKAYPKDVDVMLLLGLTYYQKSKLDQAQIYLDKVLKRVPTYLDARIGLIRVKLAQKKFKDASDLIKQAVKQAPKDPTVKDIQIFYKKVIEAQKIKVKKTEANNTQPLTKPSLIEQELAKGDIFNAGVLVNQQLKFNPCDPKLLAAKAKIFFLKHQYEEAVEYSHQALDLDSTNGIAKEVLATVKEIDPHKLYGLNEIGISSFNQDVPDRREIWDYSSLYYARATPIGAGIARINWAQRLGQKAPQGELEFLPVLNQNIYLDLDVTWANKPELFPQYSYFLEGYGTVPSFLTMSLGGSYNYIIRGTFYRKYTASFSKSLKDYWLSVRANHYKSSSGQNSTLYIATIRRYFGTNDCYLNLSLGAGHSPDLADLETLNFLVIVNKFANLSVRFPVANHRVLVDIGLDYQHWNYPSGLLRRLYGLNLGLNYKF